MKPRVFKIHRTPVILFLQVLLLMILSDIFFFLIVLFFDFAEGDSKFMELLTAKEELFLGIMLFQFFVSAYLFVSWILNYYWFDEKILFHKKGILHIQTEEYILSEVEAATCTQNLLGRIFDYGTIHLVFSRKEFYLPLVPHPENFLKIINDEKITFSNSKGF